MKFFSKIFQNFKYKSSINFKLNLFFCRNMLSTSFNHINNIHIFLPLKYLKIKIFKNNMKINNSYLICLSSTILMLFSIIYVNSNRLMVKITGFHPVDPGSIPG